MNNIDKHVATSRKTLEWNNSHRLEGDAPEAIAILKQRTEHDITIIGSSVLVRALIEHELIDLYRLLVHPFTLGKGKRLFKDGCHATLELADTRTFDTGMMLLEYKPKQHQEEERRRGGEEDK